MSTIDIIRNDFFAQQKVPVKITFPTSDFYYGFESLNILDKLSYPEAPVTELLWHCFLGLTAGNQSTWHHEFDYCYTLYHQGLVAYELSDKMFQGTKVNLAVIVTDGTSRIV